MRRFEKQKKLTLSQSGLGNYETCRAKFILSRNLNIKERYKPSYFTDGSMVHFLMESEEKREESVRVYPKKIWVAVEALRGMEEVLELDILHRELFQNVEIEGVTFRRIIDAVALKDGEYVLVDYKTAGKPWSSIRVGDKKIAPKAHTWQTPSYLYSPPQDVLDELGMERWPTKMYYLVATWSKKSQIWSVEWDKEHEESFLHMVRQVKGTQENGEFFKSPGYKCEGCLFKDACYGVNGWEERYEERSV